jgi:hypothetical protein
VLTTLAEARGRLDDMSDLSNSKRPQWLTLVAVLLIALVAVSSPGFKGVIHPVEVLN